jgi:hypothetical protein
MIKVLEISRNVFAVRERLKLSGANLLFILVLAQLPDTFEDISSSQQVSQHPHDATWYRKKYQNAVFCKQHVKILTDVYQPVGLRLHATPWTLFLDIAEDIRSRTPDLASFSAL